MLSRAAFLSALACVAVVMVAILGPSSGSASDIPSAPDIRAGATLDWPTPSAR